VSGFRRAIKPRTDQLDFVGCCGFAQLPNLKALMIRFSQQLFAPMQPTEKPIVGAQEFNITLSSIRGHVRLYFSANFSMAWATPS
jgi:hypothetical protein